MNDTLALLQEFAFAGLRVAVPLIFAAYGGLLSERAGVANIALEAYLLAGAFASAAVTALTHSIALGTASGLTAAVLVAVLFAFSCIEARADQIVVGTAINLLLMGLLPVISRSLFNVSGVTPGLSVDERYDHWFGFGILAFALAILVWFIFSKTVFGLRVTAAGENPVALTTQGVSVRKTRWYAILIGGFFAGFGGIYISMVQGSGFTRNMSAGRGFIAIAALILGRWKPIPTFLACLFFGYADSAQMLLQGVSLNGVTVPNQFVQILPYIVTLIILAGVGGKVQPPRAINQRD